MSMYSPASHVLQVPELTRLICSFVEKVNLAKLLTVSRCLFDCAAPLIWKEVSGVIKLFLLLPKLDVEELLRVGPKRLRPCSQDELARFAIYAPFVEKLQPKPDSEAGSLCWDLLLSRVPTRPLLPNLRSVTACPHDPSTNGYEVIEHVDAFLCPTLSDIRTSLGSNTWVHPFAAGRLLARMVATCPRLTKLKILPSDLGSPGLPSYASIFTPISQFCDLRTLHSGSMMLHSDVLQLLGNLPCLESLGVYSQSTDNGEDDDTPISNLVLPEHSFPSLRNLEIDCVPGIMVSNLWQTPPLVRNLISVRVQFVQGDDPEELSNLICIVCQGSPRVTDLELSVVESDGTEISSEVVEHLCHLPLRRLRIWSSYIDVQPLILGLPHLEYLNLDGTGVEFQELVLIAKQMPRLQYLNAGLALGSWPDELDFPHDSSSPSPCHIDSRFAFGDEFGIGILNPGFNEKLDNVARILHTLWPRGVHCAFGSPDMYRPAESDLGSLAHLNETTRMLSGTSAIDVPTPEESSSRWLYSSW